MLDAESVIRPRRPGQRALEGVEDERVGPVADGVHAHLEAEAARLERDALDLLAVSVEAGLGFDGAVTKLTEHMDGALVDEFGLTLGEIRIGESRAEALRKMAERVPVPEVAAFVRAVTQADQLGISLGRILRVQAADSRLRRQAAAEEKISEATNRMASMATDISSKASGQWDKLEGIFEERVARALNKLGVPSAKDIDALIARIDELNRNVAKLSAKGGGAAAPRKAPAKTPRKRVPRKAAE